MSWISVAMVLAADLLMSGCAVTATVPVVLPPGSARARLSLEAAVERARMDAARRLGMAIAAIDTVSAEPVTWPDGGLGCPQPGAFYTMAPVPGYRIKLRAQGREMAYHASERGAMLVCPAGRGTAPAPVGDSRM